MRGFKYLTLDDRIKIEEGIRAGKTVHRIAYEMGRNSSTLECEVSKSGGRYNYDAQKAHERSLISHRNGALKRTGPRSNSDKKHFQYDFLDRKNAYFTNGQINKSTQELVVEINIYKNFLQELYKNLGELLKNE